MSERIYRDSVHNIIRIETDTAEGRLLVALVDTPEFQRLRRIRQLGLGHFAYQGAEHSRFTHSLGAFHLATRILDRLGSAYDISCEERIAVRVAALLHDVGHGAFSHVIESILDFHHEDFTIQTVLSSSTGVGKLLHSYSSDLPNQVGDIIKGTFQPAALGQIVSSQLDADRMDYLLRDSHMTGAKYGIFDLEWIIKSIEIDQQNDRLYVSARGLYAVEDYLQARYYMFRQVYFHRTLRSAETILRSLLRRAFYLCQNGRNVWAAEGTAFHRVLEQKRLTIEDHLSLDDTDILFHIKRWQTSDDRILSDLSHRFLDRQLFKAFDLDMPEDQRKEFVDGARSIVEQAGFNPDYYFAEDVAGDAPYIFYTRHPTDPRNSIYVEEGFSHPKIREISEISAAIRGLQQGYRIHRICFPPEVKDKVAELYHRH
jgi:HD superfamily phosphohydrolase